MLLKKSKNASSLISSFNDCDWDSETAVARFIVY